MTAFGRPSGEMAERADQPIPRGVAAAEGGHMIMGQGDAGYASSGTATPVYKLITRQQLPDQGWNKQQRQPPSLLRRQLRE
jgi:hypothetical protein